MGVLLWIVIIGFVAGIVARLLMPGPNTPKGFIVTTILGMRAPFSQVWWATLRDCIGRVRALDSLGRLSARSLFYLSGIASWQQEPSPTTACEFCQFVDSIQRRNRPPARPRVSARLYSLKTSALCQPPLGQFLTALSSRPRSTILRARED
jgi:Predicted membrane protein